MPMLKNHSLKLLAAVCLPLVLLLAPAANIHAKPQPGAPTAARPADAPAQPAVVSMVRPRVEVRAEHLEAQGYLMPWQENHIGAEVGGLRLVSVLANVGDVVKKGQVLARLNASTVEAELDAAKAQLVEAEAALAQATATLLRANRLAPTGGISQQDLTLYETQKQTAGARVDAARAQVKKQQLRLGFATLVAPDDGVISSRSAVEGAIVPAGGELFRLIRQGRIEWRAELKGEMLLRVRAGQPAIVHSPLGGGVKGKVRQVSPTVDMVSGKGMAYVDLAAESNLKAGLMAAGTIEVGKRKVLLLPVRAILQEAGGTRVFTIGEDNRLRLLEISTEREIDGWVEIASGLEQDARVVEAPHAGLKAGDLVQVGEASSARSDESAKRTARESPRLVSVAGVPAVPPSVSAK